MKRLFLILSLILSPEIARAAPPSGWTYLGCQRLPALSGNGDVETFNYADAWLAFDPVDGGLYVTGIETGGRVGKIMPVTPSLTTNKNNLPRATLLQAPVAITSRVPNQPFNDPRVAALLCDGTNLYGAMFSNYNNRSATQGIKVSHYKFASRNLTSTITGLFAVGPLSQIPRDVVGGYMTAIPASQQAAYGGTHLTGLSCVAIISGTSAGPAVSVFTPSAIGTSPYAPATTLVDYPIDDDNPANSHPLMPWNSSNTNKFNGTTEMRGVMMEEDGDVFFFGSQGLGTFSYGTSGDTARGEMTTHAPPYQHQLWGYTRGELLDVLNGVKQPWEVDPDIYPLSLNFSTSAKYAGGMAHDLTHGIVYLTDRKSDTNSMPLLHSFQVTASAADTTPPVLSNIQVASITETTAIITWTTDEASDSRVEYGPTTAYGTILVDQADVTSHSLTLTGLTAGTLYNFRVKSWDVANNSATSANQTLTTESPPDPCAAIIAERDALLVQVADLQAQLTAANATIAALQAELDAANLKIANAKAALE